MKPQNDVNWREVHLFDVAPIRASLVDPRKPDLANMILVAPDHIESGSGRISQRVSASKQQAISGKFFVKKNSVIYSKIRPYLAKAAIADEAVLCSADMYPLECTPDISPVYLLNILLSKRFTDFAVSCSNRTGIPKINREELAQFKFLLPPLPTQKSISSMASTWDDAIEKTEQLIAAKEKQKAGVMAALLTAKQRLNGFGAPWRHWHLGELFRERVEPNRVDLPLLSITGNEGVVLRSDLDRKDTSSEDKSKYLRICPGDIGYNTMRMWQGVSALSRHEGIVSPAYTVCIPGPDIDGRFASYLFKLPAVIHLFYRYSQGLTSDTWNLKFHHFAEIRVRIPEVDEQIAIASVLAAMDEELAILRKQRDALVQQKRGLMQKLLTGQWRVNTTTEAPT